MFERDYILRLLNQFFDDLNMFINSRKKDKQTYMLFLYNTYVGDYSFFHMESIDVILESFNKYGADERFERMQMLAELYFQEAQLGMLEAEICHLYQKSLAIWECIQMNTNVYSIDRIQKIKLIRSILQRER